ncbi:MAG: 2Fe-2S iron-sulfur cluster-binding protein [Bacillota bacterium]|nr:2Fe-2S iron-sulfur cluster-binding protein [Bacillota bacterium]
MKKKIIINIDGRTVETESGKMLLDVIRDLGIYIPTLCYHPSLPRSGACRLCLVEVNKKEWAGSSRIVTSCLYPVEEGLIINTRTSEVMKTRRSLLELYMSECPGSEEIKALARLEGIDDTSFALSSDDNKCVLCGLCVRVCQDCGPGAISTQGRGIDKIIAPNPEGVADHCVGCRACAYICPTGTIPFEQQNCQLKIWNKTFEIPICTVDEKLCRGCGICEEVCPFSIPRVDLKSDGLPRAVISSNACVGCGICEGSCPTGAISQISTAQVNCYRSTIADDDLNNQDILFACPRSPLPDSMPGLYRVSCIGNIDLSTILFTMASGARSISLMCRDKLSCPYEEGGVIGESLVANVRNILKLLDCNLDYITILNPEPEQAGPLKTWIKRKETVNSIDPIVAKNNIGQELTPRGMDLALKLLPSLKSGKQAGSLLDENLRSLFDEHLSEDHALLFLDNLPELHIIFTLIGDPALIPGIIAHAVTFLKEKGIQVRPVDTPEDILNNPGRMVYTIFEPSEEIRVLKDDATSLNTLAGASGAGYSSDFNFLIDDLERNRLLEKLPQDSCTWYSINIPELLQYNLLLRTGAWLKSLSPKPLPIFSKLEENPLDQLILSDSYRIKNHPIIPSTETSKISFTFNGTGLKARNNEVITSALYASGIHIFGHHERDGGAQGIFCVNGQCSQCMVIANGKPVKGCMTPVKEGMVVTSVEGTPALSDIPPLDFDIPEPPEFDTEVLIIGGGPAGISAAIELGNVGVKVLLIDDKQELGGKLSLQTHNFFGSVADCYAGERGIYIGDTLAENLKRLPTVDIWLDSTVVGVFSDRKFGVSGGGTYRLVKAGRVLFTTGAREKSLAFPGADLPGVYGAGAFQTLVNRDLIRCAERLFIVGGGNVGLIGAYHALQAGIDVVGLVEALQKCGGYKVHEDKIKRFGVPVWTSHTVLKIEGSEKVERVITAAVDESFKPIPGTEKIFEVDTVLIAVGLSPVNELLEKAKEYGMDAYAAGDANEIAEASAAIFSGKIIGRRIAQSMGIDLPVPSDWEEFGETLKHHAGDSDPFIPGEGGDKVFPIIRCMQEIPCNPCTEACPKNCITMQDSILSLPEFDGECIGCGRCVLACPGLAINLVLDDYDPKKEKALLMMPFEFVNDLIPIGEEVTTTDMEGHVVGKGKVIAYKDRKSQNSRRLLLLEVPYKERLVVAGFRIREIDKGSPLEYLPADDLDPIVCRCERVRKSEIVQAIRDGVRDMNQLKALLRTGLGGCNGKTCTDLILRIYREEGIPISEITLPTHRPLVAEVHLGDFLARNTGGDSNGKK